MTINKRLDPFQAGVASIVFIGVMVLAPAQIQADPALIPLGDMIELSDNIVIGVVSQVADGGDPGSQLASIEVEEDLLGTAPGTFIIRGSTRDPGLPEFEAGERILAFLKQAVATDILDALEPVKGDFGVLGIADGTVDVTRSIVLKAIVLGEKLRLADVRRDLRRKNPGPPRGLVAFLTEELTIRVTVAESSLVAKMACDPKERFLRAAQLWAISRVGHLKVRKARPCLNLFVTLRRDRGKRIAATEALGDMGDRRSVPVLLSILLSPPPLVGERERAPDREEDPEVDDGPDMDDDTNLADNIGPIVDTDSNTDTHLAHDTDMIGDTGRDTDSTVLNFDGGMVQDDNIEGDRFRRRSDGGLSQSAILALGKIGHPGALPVLFLIAQEGNDLALHSTVVHAMGLIDGRNARRSLTVISSRHPNELIRDQAKRTLERLGNVD
jgi:hypothetical protein